MSIGFHPLAVEDIFHIPQRVKADYYAHHIYISLVLIAATSSPPAEHRDDIPSNDLGSQCHPSHPHYNAPNVWDFSTRLMDKFRGVKRERGPATWFRQQLRGSNGNPVISEQASLLLCEGGIVISIFEKEGDVVTTPIEDRLGIDDTLLRNTEDASFLINAIVDAIVDHGS